MVTPRTRGEGSFRVPNSIIQDLTWNRYSDLNGLTAFQTVTLLGLLARVSPKAPASEVEMRLSEILEIIEVGKQVSQDVDRRWQNEDGSKQRRRYRCRRFSPWHMQQVHEALLSLFNASVFIQRCDKKKGRRREDRQVHLLDMFGYCYAQDGKVIDLDDLPPGRQKVNVGSAERPLIRLRRETARGCQFDRPRGVTFRLNTELAKELANEYGSIGFTLIARKAFSVLKRYMTRPAGIRLILLILRQTATEFRRSLRDAIESLGFDSTHPARGADQLEQVLTELKQLRLVMGFNMDIGADALTVTRNPDWYREVEVAATE
jgi:hypothetical protein